MLTPVADTIQVIYTKPKNKQPKKKKPPEGGFQNKLSACFY